MVFVYAGLLIFEIVLSFFLRNYSSVSARDGPWYEGILLWTGAKACRFSRQRKAYLKILYPTEDIEAFCENKEKKWGTIICLTWTCVMIFGICVSLAPSKGRLTQDNCIQRAADSGAEDQVELYVSGGDLDRQQMMVDVKGRLLEGSEKEQLFEDAQAYVLRALVADNRSLEEVRSNLNPVTDIPGSSMTVLWDMTGAGLIYEDGTVMNASVEKEGTAQQLTFDLIYGKDCRSYSIEVIVFPPIVSQEESLLQKIEDDVEAENTEGASTDMLRLPSSVDGIDLKWEEKKKSPGINFFLAAGIGVIFALVLEREREKERLKEREASLRQAYPELVHKLVLLTGAGMNMKSAVETIAADDSRLHKGGTAIGHELNRTVLMMNQGVSESAAYESFGKRCGSASYMKLSTLMVQCIKKGARGMNELMASTADEARMKKRENSRQRGEMISTKLLMPMGLLLIVVLVILAVPAFMSIQGG